MAAGLGFKTFTTGEVLTAADTNGYLMQGVLVFASSAARAAAITSPQEGQYSYLKDTNSTEYYDGAAWIAAPIGDITGVTAGTGISGGGTSGTVTITNSMATEIAAKGDLIAGTGAATFDNLTVGANDTVLTADSTAATGLKWAAPASSGGMTLLSTTTLSGSSTTISSISGSYTNLYAVYYGVQTSADNLEMWLRVNSDTGSNYDSVIFGSANNAFTSITNNGATFAVIGKTTADGGAAYKGYGEFTINNYAATSIRVLNGTNAMRRSTNADTYGLAVTAQYRGSSAISSMTFTLNTGTFSAGTVLLYGVK